MSGERWIVVRNWQRFQHYKDRNPTWIKNYVELLHDPTYLELPEGCRAILHGLWLEYASSRARVRLDTRSLSRRLALRVTTRQLERLSDAGFIEFSASAPLASRARARSREAEEEEDSPPTPSQREGDIQKKLEKKTLRSFRRYTGCRMARGTHGITYVHDPLGTDPPPFGWPHPRPTRAEIRDAISRNGAIDVPGSAITDAERLG